MLLAVTGKQCFWIGGVDSDTRKPDSAVYADLQGRAGAIPAQSNQDNHERSHVYSLRMANAR